MPDAAEAAVAGGDFGLQHRRARRRRAQIGVADDAGAERGLAVDAAGAHRRDAVGEFDLADRAERLRPAGAIHRVALDKDGREDVVAGGDIGGHLLEKVALAAAVPEMMMRIDDRARGVDDLLGDSASQSSRGSA